MSVCVTLYASRTETFFSLSSSHKNIEGPFLEVSWVAVLIHVVCNETMTTLHYVFSMENDVISTIFHFL